MQTVLLATEFGNLMAWDGRSKADVDRHFSNVTDTLEMLTGHGASVVYVRWAQDACACPARTQQRSVRVRAGRVYGCGVLARGQ